MGKENNDKQNLSDFDLVTGCQQGKVAFQEKLYKRFFSFAMSICIRYAPNQSEAMEIVNDSFMKVFDRISDYDPERPFKTWFARILVNTAVDHYRSNSKHSSNLLLQTTNDIEVVEPEIDQSLGAEDILKLFSDLPEMLRVTFNLYEVEGYSHDEIGNMLGIAPSSSRANLTRAKQMLRKLYIDQFSKVEDRHERV